MFDAAPTSSHQRSRGCARVALAMTDGAVRLSDLYQEGSAKAFLPRVHADRPEVVFLNTSGGLTGGDTLSYALSVDAGTGAVATTQTAERAYRSAGGAARLDVALTLGKAAALDWLPQETILFQDSALHRHTRIDMAGDARLVMAEMVVLGRAAMGETLTGVDLRDRREIWRAGRPALVDPLRMDIAALRPRGALTAGARAFAMVALVAPGAEDALAAVRASLQGAGGVEAAASAWDGKCVVRLIAPNALPLKRAVAGVLAVLRHGAALPRVWQI